MNPRHESIRAEERAVERIVLRTFVNVSGREGEPLRWTMMDDTPVGLLGLAVSEAGLCDISYTRDEDRFLNHLLDEHGDRPLLHVPRALDEVRRQLDRYFSGKRLDFDLAVDLSMIAGFSLRVLEETAKIPPGRVMSYADVARKAGNARASRAAGNALHVNPVPIVVPCHRIVRSDGSLGGYGGGLPNKEWLLEHEGVRVKAMI
jgi:methylated-DNA-[protein]-cysteine S-methyltransferase